MNSKLYIVFALCVYQISALTYDEAFQKCKKEHNLSDDKPLDHFWEKGIFPPGYEHVKCFFSCLTSSLNVNDANGNPDGAKIKEVAKQNQNKEELQLFADDEIQKACLPGPDQSKPCEKIFSFVLCAMDEKAKAEKKPVA